jgi:uncharacterized repeat protein (TIGR01451 family)
VQIAARTDLELRRRQLFTKPGAPEIAYTLVVTNIGPSTANDVVIVDEMPQEVVYRLASTADGRCTLPAGMPNQVKCTFEPLSPGAAAQVAIIASGTERGEKYSNARVSGREMDPNLANNIALAERFPFLNYLPVIRSTGQTGKADLTATLQLVPDRRSFAAGEQVKLWVAVTNSGTRAAKGFWVDLYINPLAPPAGNTLWSRVCGLSPCFGIAWYVPGLEPGESITLTSTVESMAPGHTIWPGWFAAGTSDLYVYVDSYGLESPAGAVAELDEGNNLVALHGLVVGGVNPAQAPDASISWLPLRASRSAE